MVRFDLTRTINAPLERAWSLLRDTSMWSRCNPMISDVESTRRFILPGQTGSLKLTSGLRIPFCITALQGSRWEWTLAGFAATAWRVDPFDDGRCVVVLEIPVLTPWYAAVGWKTLDRIESLLESGEYQP